MARKRSVAAGRRTRRKARNCEPFAQILVRAVAPGTRQSTVQCTSDTDFLVYFSTNYFGASAAPPGWGYAVGVKSTGASSGSESPVYIVGGVANDIVTFIVQPGVTAFVTVQTQCSAKADITLT